jgi:hypothetical protein
MDAAGCQADLAVWHEDHDAVDTARSKWTAAHAEFINAARRELDILS